MARAKVMLYYTSGQWRVLACMMLCGVIMGGVCELFRLARLLTAAGAALTALLDAVMCAVLAIVMSAMLLRANGGEIRLYALAGCALGMAIFEYGPARLLRWGMARLMCALERARRRAADIAFFKHIMK